MPEPTPTARISKTDSVVKIHYFEEVSVEVSGYRGARGLHTNAIVASKSSRPSTLTINPRTYSRVHSRVADMTMKAMLKLTSDLPCESGGRLNMEKSIVPVELLMLDPLCVVMP